MTQTVNYPMSSSFAGVSSLQADGTSGTGNSLPSGIGTSLFINNSYMVSAINQNDPTTFTGIRSEILMPVEAATGEVWYAWQFMLPSALFAPAIDPISLMQIHAADDLGAIANPFVLLFEQGNFFAGTVPSATLPAQSSGTKINGMVPVIYDHWYSAVMRVNWQTDVTGFREFFLDQQPLFREYNIATTYSDASAGYFKAGCYDSTHNARFGSCTAYYKNFASWTGNAGYEAVMGTGNIPQPNSIGISA